MKIIILKTSAAIFASMFLISTVWAGFGGGKQGPQTATYDRQIIVQVAKCSAKGEKAGWIDDADKSLECTGVDSGGNGQKFSASETQQGTLMSHANQWARIYLQNKRLTNATTDWAFVNIKPISPPVKMRKACEIDQRKPSDKLDSSGFRMVRVVDVINKGEQTLKGYIGSIGDEEWGFEKKAPVNFPSQCKAAIEEAMGLFKDGQQSAVAMEYIQEDLGRDYEVFRIWLPSTK